jgi:hypothetical protein
MNLATRSGRSLISLASSMRSAGNRDAGHKAIFSTSRGGCKETTVAKRPRRRARSTWEHAKRMVGKYEGGSRSHALAGRRQREAIAEGNIGARGGRGRMNVYGKSRSTCADRSGSLAVTTSQSINLEAGLVDDPTKDRVANGAVGQEAYGSMEDVFQSFGEGHVSLGNTRLVMVMESDNDIHVARFRVV